MRCSPTIVIFEIAGLLVYIRNLHTKICTSAQAQLFFLSGEIGSILVDCFQKPFIAKTMSFYATDHGILGHSSPGIDYQCINSLSIDRIFQWCPHKTMKKPIPENPVDQSTSQTTASHLPSSPIPVNNHTRSNAMNQRTSDSECDDSRIRVCVIINVFAQVSLLSSFRLKC